jgi:hypothetical protein
MLRCGLVIDAFSHRWFVTMRLSPLRCALGAVLALTASACATSGKDDAFQAEAAKLMRFPACESEIKAFVALTRLARQAGDNWQIYQPALDALQDQIMDCVEDSYPNPIPI